METSIEAIDHSTLAQLASSGAVGGADIIGRGGAWGVIVKCGKKRHSLAAKRGSLRTFRKFETLVSYLAKLGILQFHVNAIDFNIQPHGANRVRPDASARMRGVFAAKAHTDWIIAKAAQSLHDPRPNVPHQQVMTGAQALIDAQKKKHARKAAA